MFICRDYMATPLQKKGHNKAESYCSLKNDYNIFLAHE